MKINQTDGDSAESMLSIYHRAEAMEHESFVESMVLNSTVFPHWIGDSQSFWYIRKRRHTESEEASIAKEYRLVDVEAGSNIEAFDHQLLAQKLSLAIALPVNPDDLPIGQLRFESSPFSINFVAFGRHWKFNPSKDSFEEVSVNPDHWLFSPDGKKVVFLRDFNLWMRIWNGDECALTEGRAPFCLWYSAGEI